MTGDRFLLGGRDVTADVVEVENLDGLLSGPWAGSVQRLADEQDAAEARVRGVMARLDEHGGDVIHIRGARPNLVITDELLGRVDPDPVDVLRARVDEATLVGLWQHADRSIVDHLGEQSFEPRPADVEAVLAAWREFVASVTVAYEQIGQALVPQLAVLREAIADAAALVLGPHPEDEGEPEGVAERALWLKQRPGRTGPPARRMDGRRGR